MLTIAMMVRVGPWTVRAIDIVREPEHCERCDTVIKEVWVCEVDADAKQLATLDGKRVWRIGNDCGPRLMSLAQDRWDDDSREVRMRLQRAKRYFALREVANAKSYELPSNLVECGEALLNGTLDRGSLKYFGLVMTDHEKALKLRK